MLDESFVLCARPAAARLAAANARIEPRPVPLAQRGQKDARHARSRTLTEVGEQNRENDNDGECGGSSDGSSASTVSLLPERIVQLGRVRPL